MSTYYVDEVAGMSGSPLGTLVWIGLAILVAVILVIVFLRFVPLGL